MRGLKQAIMALGLAFCGSAAIVCELGAQSTAPPASDVQLLDDTPNVFETLADSWSGGVPEDVTDAETSTANYGLLLNAAPQPTTLAQCIELALKNNTSLQVQRLNPLAATAAVRRARSVYDPDLFATILRDRSTSPSFNVLAGGGAPIIYNQNFTLNAGVRKTLLTGGQLALQFTNNRRVANPSVINPLVPLYTTGLGLTLNQPLLENFGWRYSLLLVDVAQQNEQATFFQYEAAVTNIVALVERAYWALVLAAENVHVQERGMTLAQELLRQNEGKFKVGSLPQTAVLEAQVDTASREALLIQARNNLDVARDQLRALINAKGDDGKLIMVDPVDEPTVEAYHVDLQRSLGLALTERPELAAARHDVHARGLERKVAQNQLLPQLNLVAGIGVNGLAGTEQPITFNGQPVRVNPSITGGYADALGLLPDGRYYNYTVGATVDVPIDNALAKANYAQSNIRLSQSKLGLQQLQENVTLEIKTAVSNLQSDLKSIEATRIARQLAQENVRNQRARYDVGLATTKDLLDYADRLTRAEFAAILSLIQYNTDLAEMRRVEGSLLAARNVIVQRVQPEPPPWWARF